MQNNDYLTKLSKIVFDLNNALEKDDHQQCLLLCAELTEFRKESNCHEITTIDEKDAVLAILPHIDLLIDKLENNKQVLAGKIYSLRKTIHISKNQDEI